VRQRISQGLALGRLKRALNAFVQFDFVNMSLFFIYLGIQRWDTILPIIGAAMIVQTIWGLFHLLVSGLSFVAAHVPQWLTTWLTF
jgi:hypothetical protein